jgi:hypothetical protein
MNIFFLDRNLTKCAQAHCDKHVNKMILEGAQLLSSAHHMTNPEAANIPDMYRLTHKNHPDAIWVRASINHYLYLLDLMEALNEEAQWRYGHGKVHVSLDKAKSWPFPDLPDVKFVDPPKCVHDDFKGIPDAIDAYRAYYCRDKAPIASWTKRQPPDWFIKK